MAWMERITVCMSECIWFCVTNCSLESNLVIQMSRQDHFDSIFNKERHEQLVARGLYSIRV